MGDQTQAYDIFQTPLSSGYPLPLSSNSTWSVLLSDSVIIIGFLGEQMLLDSSSLSNFLTSEIFDSASNK